MRVIAWLLMKLFSLGGYRSPNSDEPVTKRDSTREVKEFEERRIR